MKSRAYQPHRLDIVAFSRAQDHLAGELEAAQVERLRTSEYAPAASDAMPAVAWEAVGETRSARAGSSEAWLHVTAQARVPLVCQRCLDTLMQEVRVDRWFRFVETETLAEELDVDAEEDVLALTSALDLPALIEDEVLLALPLVPRHDVCPAAVAHTATSADDAVGQEREHPFAGLSALKPRLAPTEGEPEK